ncbi:hypothetical protein [Novosphingobium mangrovi (ex Hu et al. 2023)]|uniref:Uncharacterized protein n=1 Tax=Novosphingobium mangrovi (ex Hu et al. 2023) TaxID=2930094 RepID=A0ABT0ABF4_9SPHN|nr:hypothetical protein [Novosphingobium mangrovi (ex Hu et al. 2023)]MCJ1960528.1 hypothetical protein [Novosphingobium mangrovi (ex Hu et al. 2023)]
MSFSRPIELPRWPEFLCFAIAICTAIAALAYLFDAHFRGLIKLRDLPVYWLGFLVGAIPIVVCGMFLRRRRLSKTAARLEYDRVLAFGSAEGSWQLSVDHEGGFNDD